MGQLREKCAPVPLCAPQIPQRIGWDPRRTFVHQREELTPGRVKLHKEELCILSQYVIRMDKSHGCP